MISFSFDIPKDMEDIPEDKDDEEVDEDLQLPDFRPIEEYEEEYLSNYFDKCQIKVCNASIYLIQPCRKDRHVSIFYKYSIPNEEWGSRITNILNQELEGFDRRNIELAANKVRRMVGGPSSLGFQIYDEVFQLSNPDEYDTSFTVADDADIEIGNVDRINDPNESFWRKVETELERRNISIHYEPRNIGKRKIFEY